MAIASAICSGVVITFIVTTIFRIDTIDRIERKAIDIGLGVARSMGISITLMTVI